MRLLLLLCLVGVVHSGFFDSILSKITGKGSSGSSSSSSSSSSPKKEKYGAVSDDKAKKYLQDFGYVGPSNSLASAPRGMAADLGDATSLFRRAITKFQEFAGLRKTGELDESTREKMAEPRCGVTDVEAITSGGAAFKWKKNRLTYSIETYSSDLPREDIRRSIREAYDVWSAVTPLEFEEVPAGSTSDIKVRFGTGNHNDPWPFDGKGGVLAHATMPESGILHFDDDENWVYGDARKIATNSYTDLFAVAVHEGGHTLGLSHSRDEESIMAPFYHKTIDDNGNYIRPKLKPDDIRSIQDIYGPRTTPPRNNGGGFGDSDFGGGRATTQATTTTRKKSWFGGLFGDDEDTTTPRPTTRRPTATTSSGFDFGGSGTSSGGSTFPKGSASGCPRSIDAYTPSDSFSYLFSGSKVYSLSTGGKQVYKTYEISELFPSAPSHIDAAVFNPNSGLMLLFAGGRIYGYYYSRLRGIFQLDTGYPKRLPADIDFMPMGALRWINGHQIVLSDGDDFSVYDEFWNQSTLRNRISSYFPNLPRGIKGIESPMGSTVTAFSKNTVYVYDSRRKQVTDSQPLSSYLRC